MASLDGHPTRKRLKISLEPIHAPQIDFICPDGSVVELPPTYTDPAVLFARQVCYQSNFGIIFRLCPLWYRWIDWSQKTRKKTKNRIYLQASRKRNPSHLCGKLLWITYAMLRFNVANYPRSLGCCQGSSYIFAVYYICFTNRVQMRHRERKDRGICHVVYNLRKISVPSILQFARQDSASYFSTCRTFELCKPAAGSCFKSIFQSKSLIRIVHQVQCLSI